MVRPFHLRLVPLGVVLALGCRGSSESKPLPSPPDGYEFAFATPDCAPWDGRAISILLTGSYADSVDGAGRQVRVAVYPRSDSVAGRRFRWPSDPEIAAGTRCRDAASCESAPSGEIDFRPTESDSLLEGRLVLRFTRKDSVYGGFRAEWRPRRVMCG